MIHNRACSNCGKRCFFILAPCDLQLMRAVPQNEPLPEPPFIACSQTCYSVCEARLADGEVLASKCICGHEYDGDFCGSEDAKRILTKYVENRLEHGKPMNLGGVRDGE